MSLKKMLTDKCDIYQLNKIGPTISYGVPVQKSYDYPIEPTLTDVACYITKNKAGRTQAEPFTTVAESLTIYFDCSVSIHLNDLVTYNGAKYICGVPKSIRNHHIEVEIVRKS